MPGQQPGGDLYIPLFDADISDTAPWHHLVEHFPNPLLSDDLLWSSAFAKYAFLPGISSMAQCDDDHANTAIVRDDESENVFENSFGLHRSKDAMVGSFSYHSASASFVAKRRLQIGQEIIVPCNPGQLESQKKTSQVPLYLRDLTDTDETLCVDTLHVQSSLKAPGRGAFSKLQFSKGERVTTSPVKFIRRSEVEIENPNGMELDFLCQSTLRKALHHQDGNSFQRIQESTKWFGKGSD